ncbi:MAG: SafA/ExsA family spore coat assembly protein [Bacillota bacterium]
MRKKTIWIILPILLVSLFTGTVLAVSDIYTVQKGDSLWKIAVKYQIGLSEIIGANPQIKNPDLIYPGDKITVPNIDEIKAVEAEVIRLTNLERTKNGLPALKSNWELSRVARYKSADMRDNKYFGHTSPVYGGPFQMMSDFGIHYSAAGENIAKGYYSAAAVVQGWMNSAGHRANILNANFTQIGVGLAIDSTGTKYWTQMFIRP